MSSPEPITSRVRHARFTIGRWLVHFGVRVVMPPGRVRAELTDLLNEWGQSLMEEIAHAR